ncbi:MAG: hypothetical protein Tsb004_28300 [Allomuricauda sp.]
MKLKTSLFVSLIVIWQCAYAQQLDSLQQAEINKLLAPYIADSSPGVALGIVRNGEMVHEGYTGYASLEHRISIGKKTRFNIASNAKQFTALCILKLRQENKLKLDDDLRLYLPNLYPNATDTITIAHLINHSSGIRDVYDLWALQGKNWYELFLDNGDAIALIERQRDLNFTPGTQYMYSNSNYILLTAIIEQVTGGRFSDFATALFEQMDMTNTEFLTNYMAIVPHKARPYGNWSGWKEYLSITEIHGDGALFTTLRDQLQWEKILQGETSGLLSDHILMESQKPVKGSNIAEYGFGLMFGSHRGLAYTYHDGSTGAYNATFLRFPTERLAIVVISNNGNVPTHYLAKSVADILLEVKTNEDVYPSGPDKLGRFQENSKLLGAYMNEEGTIIKIIEKEDGLYRDIYQRKPARLIHEKGNLYYYQNHKDLKMAFTEGPLGRPQFTIYLSSQPPNTYEKMEVVSVSENEIQSINGTFYNDETDTRITIAHDKDRSYTIEKNGRERKGELLYKDFLRMNSYQIKIHRDRNDEVDGLLVTNGRIKNVWFAKEK